MGRKLTIFHPVLKQTAQMSEGGFYGKGGARDRGWVLYDPDIHSTTPTVEDSADIADPVDDEPDETLED